MSVLQEYWYSTALFRMDLEQVLQLIDWRKATLIGTVICSLLRRVPIQSPCNETYLWFTD
jgi:hypothetical protein